MYKLLNYHMNCNPSYMFQHACIAGMLAENSEKVNTYKKYALECRKLGILYYNKECYDEFMVNCNRTSHLKKIIQSAIIIPDTSHPAVGSQVKLEFTDGTTATTVVDSLLSKFGDYKSLNELTGKEWS